MPSPTSSRRLLLLFPAVTLTLACRSFTGYPHQMQDSLKADTADTAYLTSCFTGAQVQKCQAMTDAAAARTCRNELVDCQIRSIDFEFIDFERSLNKETNGMSFASDVAVGSLSAAATILTGTTQKILSALAGVVGGAKSSIDKNVYYTKTLPALMLTMEASRATKLTTIRNGEKLSVTDYTLDAALSDVDAYFSAGSIPGAISEISATQGTTKTNNDKTLADQMKPAQDKSKPPSPNQ